MRPAVFLAAVFLTAAHVPAQPPDALSGTWYAAHSARVVLRAGSDTTANPLDTSALITLTLHVDGNTVTGEERRALTIPSSEFANPKAFTMTAVRQVTGTVEGDIVRLVMTPEHGAPLVYEGTLRDEGRHLALVFVPDDPRPGVEVPTLIFERAEPKPRPFKD